MCIRTIHAGSLCDHICLPHWNKTQDGHVSNKVSALEQTEWTCEQQSERIGRVTRRRVGLGV